MLGLLGQVVRLSLEQILALVNTVVRVLAERAGYKGRTLAVAARHEQYGLRPRGRLRVAHVLILSVCALLLCCVAHLQ